MEISVGLQYILGKKKIKSQLATGIAYSNA